MEFAQVRREDSPKIRRHAVAKLASEPYPPLPERKFAFPELAAKYADSNFADGPIKAAIAAGHLDASSFPDRLLQMSHDCMGMDSIGFAWDKTPLKLASRTHESGMC